MCARTRVLLVNDDPDALFHLSRSVRRALPDAEIAQLRDGPSALEYCDKHGIDALITDNTMPRMDGLARGRSGRRRDASVPSLIGTHSTHLAEEAAQAGVTSYLPAARWSDVGPILASLLRT